MNILRFASLLFLLLSYADAENVTLEKAELCANVTATPAELGNITLLLYRGDTVDNYTSFLIGDASDLVKYINGSKPTVIYIFGWTETPTSSSPVAVIGAYLGRKDHNIILMNWKEIAAQLYTTAACKAESIGKTMARGINEMVAAGLNSSTIHIVSHSLGSQIAGFIGRNTNSTVPRITGLDPAGPGFYFIVESLTSAVANFVDNIHTDAGFYGTATNGGTVDFFPNGGTRFQPGCQLLSELFSDEDFCSHHRSWRYYAESLRNESAFMGVACDSYSKFLLRLCSGGETAIMGYATPTTTSGKYYLRTNNASSYGRGADGTK